LISEAVVSNVKAGGFKTKTSCSFLSVTIAWPLHKGIPTMVVWKFIWPLLFADLLGIPHSMYGNSLPLDAHYSTITLWHSTKWFAFAWCNSQGKKEGPTYPLFATSLALQNKLVAFFIIGKVLHNIINPYCKMPYIKKINTCLCLQILVCVVLLCHAFSQELWICLDLWHLWIGSRTP
jgi:hypothetical protein